MNLQEKANVHNKFEFTVVDAKTGKEKQKAVAYNTILDQWFNARVVNAYPSYNNGASRTYDVLQYITLADVCVLPLIAAFAARSIAHQNLTILGFAPRHESTMG